MASSGARGAWQDPTLDTLIVLDNMEKGPRAVTELRKLKHLRQLDDSYTRAHIQRDKMNSQNNYHSLAIRLLAAFLPPW